MCCLAREVEVGHHSVRETASRAPDTISRLRHQITHETPREAWFLTQDVMSHEMRGVSRSSAGVQQRRAPAALGPNSGGAQQRRGPAGSAQRSILTNSRMSSTSISGSSSAAKCPPRPSTSSARSCSPSPQRTASHVMGEGDDRRRHSGVLLLHAPTPQAAPRGRTHPRSSRCTSACAASSSSCSTVKRSAVR